MGFRHMTILMAHNNIARVENGRFQVDRKFLVGMRRYAELIRAPLITVHPEATGDTPIMDRVEAPCSELPFKVMTVKVDGWGRTLPADIPRLRDAISASVLVYGWGLSAAKLAAQLNVPYILVLEYDLGTQIVATTSQTANPLRRANRAVRCAWRYFTVEVPEMRRAQSLHCNGYPIYQAVRSHNPSRLLYLDSRLSEDMLISPQQLAARLASRVGRPLRLLYSGRYERMKGVDDAIRVAIECLRRGLDVEMYCYGQGSLRADMEALAATAARPDRIHINDSVPYPELVKIAQTCDVFVCCHIQSDPSCTYLESLGAGLPIVGYDNRMWRSLCRDSRAGYSSRLGRPGAVADAVQRLASDHQILAAMSAKAREFAQAHCYEREFAKRIDALNAAVSLPHLPEHQAMAVRS
jgi:glycosyltransferase involved in cell wall biosynthesis